jgi:hypothetical protein
MLFLAKINRGYVVRTVEFDAPHGAAARAIAERMCEAGEHVESHESAVMLASRRTVDPNPIMPSDHARNVAIGRKSGD